MAESIGRWLWSAVCSFGGMPGLTRAAYIYPLATHVKGEIDSRTTGRFAFTIDVKSEIPITDLKSPSHADKLALEFLRQQRARGGTELRPAVATAYKFKDADGPTTKPTIRGASQSSHVPTNGSRGQGGEQTIG